MGLTEARRLGIVEVLPAFLQVIHSMPRLPEPFAMQCLCLVCGGVLCTGSVLAETPSHCAPAEQILFHCRMQHSAKMLSLCAARDLSATSGYLQYRFGRPGKVELEFPQDRTKTQRHFRYSHYFRFQTDRTELSFRHGGFEYVVYSDYEGDMKPARKDTGVRVNTTELPCGGQLIDRLSRLASVVPCDEQAALGCEP